MSSEWMAGLVAAAIAAGGCASGSPREVALTREPTAYGADLSPEQQETRRFVVSIDVEAARPRVKPKASGNPKYGSDLPFKNPPSEMPSRYDGIIRAYDETVGLYFVSVGSKDGVKVGQTVNVSRDGGFVAELVVDRVFDDRATATVRNVRGISMRKSPIHLGDRVTPAN
jgi:hypothetical protein